MLIKKKIRRYTAPAVKGLIVLQKYINKAVYGYYSYFLNRSLPLYSFHYTSSDSDTKTYASDKDHITKKIIQLSLSKNR